MWFFFIYMQLTANQAQDRIALRGSRSPCEGRLEVYHDGQWGLVGHHYWEDVNGMVVCKSLDCGDHVKSGILSQFHTNLKNQLETFWMDEIQCTGKEKWLWDCPFNGWKIARCLSHNFVSVVCSGKISLGLNLSGLTNECAGVVQFTTPTKKMKVCDQNWNDAVANKVCQELHCGNYQKRTSSISKAIGSSFVYLRCTGNEEFSWQCVDLASAKSCKEEISIVCTKHNHIRLYGGPDVCEGFLEKENSTEGKWSNVKCEEVDSNMIDTLCVKLECGTAVGMKPCSESENTWLKCSDRVKIELGKSMKTPSPCYGGIYVNVNSSHHAVCSKDLISSTMIGEVVCRELQCGTPLSVVQGSVMKQGQYSLDDCHGQEKSLWECMHKNGYGDSCQNISIVCSGSLDLRLSNGLDKCAGQLEVNLFGSWKSMNTVNWSKQNSDMVCQHLNCGRSMEMNQHHFVRSKLPTWNGKLECSGSSISQCNMAAGKNILQYSFVYILCSKHKLWFLEGSSSCEGKVKDETGGYLQNITNKMADEVCQRNLCGGLQILNMASTICPENTNTAFNCTMKNSTVSTSTELQDAYVKCSGSMEVRLQNKCHGKVLVCSNDSCGVCMDTWTEAQSEMLCKSLDCGQMIKETYRGKTTPGVTIASVHCSPTAENFSQCNFVKLTDTSLCEKTAHISCTGSVKAVLQDPRDKCAGIPKLFYSGSLYPLCTNSIDKNTQNKICANCGCGEALGYIKAISSISTSQGLTRITCPANNISSCDFSKTEIQACEIGHLKCTDWRRLVLINHRDACKGKVYLQNETHLNAVSNDGWNNQEGNVLCQYLECGKVSEIMNEEQMGMPFWSRSFSCPEKPNSIWDCEKERGSVKNSHQLHISCTDEPKMTLNGNCTGEVWLNNKHVCYKSEKTEGVFNEFCFQQGCSMLFKTWSTRFEGNARFLSCTGNESMLWQCSTWISHCDAIVSLACAKALNWKLSRPCGGKLLVNYRGQWEPVCPVENKKDADRICRDLKCGNANRYFPESLGNPTTDIRINCINNPSNLMHCFESGPDCRQSAVIYCDNYEVTKSKPATGLIVGVVVGIVLLLVAVLIIYWKRTTILAVYAIDADDYEDIASTVNSMEHNDDASEYDEEDASTSQNSSGTEYDDVDEGNIKRPAHSSFTKPFLPPRPKDLLDKVTFEAEVEPQEEYDDVILPQTVINEQRESFDIPGPSSEPPLPVSIDEGKLQKEK